MKYKKPIFLKKGNSLVDKKHEGAAKHSLGSMDTVGETVWEGTVSKVIFVTQQLNQEVWEALVEENNLG